MVAILLVDDDINILEVIGAILEYSGYTVRCTGNGREALEYLQNLERGDLPDLILSDTMMPVMDGRELCRRLGADPSFSAIPFVLMSGGLSAPARDGPKHAAFIAKPFEDHALLSTLQQVLGEKQTK